MSITEHGAGEKTPDTLQGSRGNGSFPGNWGEEEKVLTATSSFSSLSFQQSFGAENLFESLSF